MHRIIPEIIVANYRANNQRGSFMAASMFLDISGFSTMVDTLIQRGQFGSEVLAKMMRQVFDPIVNAVFEQGGLIVGYAGDAVTALYPIETDPVEAARRALASAYCIQQGMLSNPFYETPFGTFRISAKIGLAVGGVSWGILRSRNGEKATYYFRGIAVDDASKAEHQARAGEILLAQEIYELLNGIIKTEPVAYFHRLSRVSEHLPSSHPIDLPPVDVEISNIFAPHPSIIRGVRAEFRQAVHLFMRIPDLKDEQLEHFMHALFDLQERYGGVIDRIDFGDKGCNMTVLWGAPVAYENDIGRSLNFILELQSLVSFPITAGITYYISHAGYVGGGLYENYTCYGWGINLASRLMMSAPEGTVWLDERVVQRIQKRFWFDFVGAQNFKGFAQEQKVYVLRGRKTVDESFFQGDMFGREAELKKLTDFVSPLWNGKGTGFLCVWGEAGMGKSRLIHEFRHSSLFQDRSVLWALCQSDQVLRQSFNPLRYWLFQYFNLLPEDDAAIRLQKFSHKLDDLVNDTEIEDLKKELKRTSSFLAALVDLSWPDSTYEQLDAQGRYDNTILALLSLLKAESTRQPLILFIEDVHFLDDDSKKFITRLKRALLAETTSYPIAVLMTTRWQGSRAVLEENLVDVDIDLDGLSDTAFIQMAQDILGQVPAPSLIKLVVERADGNPFFAEQILRYLQDESLLESSDSGIRIKNTRKISVLPSDIINMLIARLDQLALQVKEVIHAASVLGREFEVQVLSRMMRDDPSLNDGLAQAEQARVWSPLSEIRYIFKHSMLRDVAYNMQLQSRRQELHALAFHSLEELYGADIYHHYGELAYHSEQALLVDEARYYLQKAGDAARDTYLNKEAADYYSRALAIKTDSDLSEQYSLFQERAAIYGRMGDRSSQLSDLDMLETLGRQLANEEYLARAHMYRADYLYATGDFVASIQSVEHVTGYLTESPNELLGIYITWSNSLLRLGRLEEALQHAKEGLTLMRLSGRRLEEGRMLSSMGLIAIDQNEPETAQEYLIEAVRIARELQILDLEGKALNNLANVAGFILSDFALARDYYEQAFSIFHERGDYYGEGLITSNLGWCAGMQGEFDAAMTYLKQALLIAREVGNAYQETYNLINLSAVSGIQGDSILAMQYASQAYDMSLKVIDHSSQAWAYLYLGHANLLAGEWEKAEQEYRESIRIRNELKQSSLAMEPTAGLIQTALSRNALSSAIQQTETILEYLAGGGTLEGTEEPLRIYYACYSALKETKDPRANDVLAAAIHLLDGQVSKFRDETARRMYVENVPWRLAVQKAWEGKLDQDP